MLDAELKDQIQDAYRKLLACNGYKPRTGQRLMIAEIARVLANIEADAEGARTSGNPVCVVEAGTGTGKTLAYLLGALPIAMARGKQLVISTATIMLQEQLLSKDLPGLMEGSGLGFTFALAKGRGRYLCRSKLESIASMSSAMHGQALFEDEAAALPDKDVLAIYEDLRGHYDTQQWSGERDSCPAPLRDSDWFPITTDHRQCTNRRCAYFTECCYFKARQAAEEADVIVANHDLVVSDLMLGGGVLLPMPEHAIYVFDEGHHLPGKALGHLRRSFRAQSTRRWLQQLPKLAVELITNAATEGWAHSLQNLPELVDKANTSLEMAIQLVAELDGYVRQPDGPNKRLESLRFAKGQFPEGLDKLAIGLVTTFTQIQVALEAAGQSLADRLEKEDPDQRQRLEADHNKLMLQAARAEASIQLWESYSVPNRAGSAPTARWINRIEQPDVLEYEICSSPLQASGLLVERLWDRCFGAVVTSATLASTNGFDRLLQNAAIPKSAVCAVVPSPFDYASAVQIDLPRMSAGPSQGHAFTEAVTDTLKELLQDKKATLVVFSARKQMQTVYQDLDEDMKLKVLLQDDYSKQKLLELHRNRIDRGDPSIIFGLASLTEGVDLPGDYLRHVILVRLPFSVPGDPVEATLSEWLAEQGKDAFWEISVPEAALRLKQVFGRLIRTETDTGTLTILDNRVSQKGYGKMLLRALPGRG